MSELQRMYVGGNSVKVGFELERRINEGWEIDPDSPLTAGPFGALDCWLIRDPANAKDAPPRKTRAEILADARAAKAAKRAENKEEPTE